MWFKEPNGYFCEIENFAYGEINERSFSNPHPWAVTLMTIPFPNPNEFRCVSNFIKIKLIHISLILHNEFEPTSSHERLLVAEIVYV